MVPLEAFVQGDALSPPSSGSLTTLYAFTGGADESDPLGGLTLGAGGVTLFGTASDGGASGFETVFELTPAPEPGAVLGVAAAGLGLVRWVRRRKGQASLASANSSTDAIMQE